MKKNIAMRVAAFLFILTMISTTAFATTFAKYTTKGESHDSARVAKWGVTISAVGGDKTTFEYNSDTKDAEVAEITAQNDVKLIAPGSKVNFGSVKITGKPEVKVKVSFTIDVELTGWEIPDKDDSTKKEQYCPLVFVVNGKPIAMNDSIKTIDKLEEAIEAEAAVIPSTEYAANTDLSSVAPGGVSIYCYWDFNETDNAGDYQSDVKDTALGDLSSAPKVSLTIECTVEQVD